jgi:hypothetical protein
MIALLEVVDESTAMTSGDDVGMWDLESTLIGTVAAGACGEGSARTSRPH